MQPPSTGCRFGCGNALLPTRPPAPCLPTVIDWRLRIQCAAGGGEDSTSHFADRSLRFEARLRWAGLGPGSSHPDDRLGVVLLQAHCRRHDVADHGWPAQQFHWLPIPTCSSQFRRALVLHVPGPRAGKCYQPHKLNSPL